MSKGNNSTDLRFIPPLGSSNQLVGQIFPHTHVAAESLTKESIVLLTARANRGFWVRFIIDNSLSAVLPNGNSLTGKLAGSGEFSNPTDLSHYFAGEITSVLCGNELDYYKEELAIRGLVAIRHNVIEPRGFTNANIEFVKKSDLAQYQDQINRYNQALSE